MSYKKMKFNYVVNMRKIIGEIDDIQLPPPYDNAFKQLVFDDTQAREEFLKLADFVNKNFSIEKQKIHIAGIGAISLASFLTLCSCYANETAEYLLVGWFSLGAACSATTINLMIDEIKCFLKNDSLLSLTYATLKKDTQLTNFDIINTKLDDTDYICAKTIIYNAFDKQLIEMLENLNDKEREM